MFESIDSSSDNILKWIQAQAEIDNIRVTQHAQQRMVEENITLDEVLEAVIVSEIVENYPQHRRGACCLVNGFTHTNRPIHVVCTTSGSTLIIITVYEPMLPKWLTPTERKRQR